MKYLLLIAILFSGCTKIQFAVPKYKCLPEWQEQKYDIDENGQLTRESSVRILYDLRVCKYGYTYYTTVCKNIKALNVK